MTKETQRKLIEDTTPKFGERFAKVTIATSEAMANGKDWLVEFAREHSLYGVTLPQNEELMMFFRMTLPDGRVLDSVETVPGKNGQPSKGYFRFIEPERANRPFKTIQKNDYLKKVIAPERWENLIKRTPK